MSQLLTLHRPSTAPLRTTLHIHRTPYRLPAQIPLAADLPPQLRALYQSSTGTQLTAGSLLGFATGYAAKRIGQLLIVITGAQVVAVQLMAKRGWLAVDWDRIVEDLAPHVQRNRIDRFMDIAKFRVPFAGSFSAGCYAGFRWS